jgi:hypothetical protein
MLALESRFDGTAYAQGGVPWCSRSSLTVIQVIILSTTTMLLVLALVRKYVEGSILTCNLQCFSHFSSSTIGLYWLVSQDILLPYRF